jgi:hypothetical protein
MSPWLPFPCPLQRARDFCSSRGIGNFPASARNVQPEAGHRSPGSVGSELAAILVVTRKREQLIPALPETYGIGQIARIRFDFGESWHAINW